MNYDLIASMELTACSAIAIAVLSAGFGETFSAKIKIASALTVWFIVVTLLGATGALGYKHGTGAPGLGVAVMLPIIMLSMTVLRSPILRRRLDAIPLPVLMGVHAIRILGVSFLILYAAGRLPAPFAPLAGWGDIIAGITAIPAAFLAARGFRGTVFVWNTFGLLDLAAAIGLGATSSPGPLHLIMAKPDTTIMTALPWLIIPGFLVPLLASIHLAVFYRLKSSKGKGEVKNSKIRVENGKQLA